VRALTRNPESAAAETLAEDGAEVIQGDLTDPSTLDAAFKDCWGAFVVTNFYDSVGTSSHEILEDVKQWLLTTYSDSRERPTRRRNPRTQCCFGRAESWSVMLHLEYAAFFSRHFRW
jgi:Trk K+ transport system NAD-binding subunit